MEGLLSLLLFAGLFFVMMRFGCGSHMKHAHHGSGEQKDSDNVQQKNIDPHTDPVCGMKVEADQGYGKMHEGDLYRFCSRDCLDKFEANPEQYITEKLELKN